MGLLVDWNIVALEAVSGRVCLPSGAFRISATSVGRFHSINYSRLALWWSSTAKILSKTCPFTHCVDESIILSYALHAKLVEASLQRTPFPYWRWPRFCRGRLDVSSIDCVFIGDQTFPQLDMMPAGPFGHCGRCLLFIFHMTARASAEGCRREFGLPRRHRLPLYSTSCLSATPAGTTLMSRRQ